MNLRCISVSVFIAVCACTSGAAKEDAFLQYRPPVSLPFGIVQAQALADARRNEIYGSCGMCVFKKKEGAVWTFKTKVGYSGLPAADISVVEPQVVLPSFGESEKTANQSSEPTSPSVTPRAEPRVAPAGAAAHL